MIVMLEEILIPEKVNDCNFFFVTGMIAFKYYVKYIFIFLRFIKFEKKGPIRM